MQQILLLALRNLLTPWPQMAIMRIYKVFKRLCSKALNPNDIESLQLDVLINLTLVEMHFPSSFLTS
jgi:hypothetical protein